MTALAAHPRAPCRFELVTSEDLDEEYASTSYRVHAILPPLRDRAGFASPLTRAASRALHYARREWQFLRWLRGRPDVTGAHFQAWTPWLAAPMFRRIRRMGKKIFYTVHNLVPHEHPRLVPKAVMARWVRKACLLVDGLFTHTDGLAAELAASRGDPHPPVRVIPHGVWTVRRPVAAPTRGERWPWKRLLFFGEVRQNKGLDLLLRATQFLPGYRVTIAGEVREPEYFRNNILPLVRRRREAGVEVDLRDSFVPDDEVPALFSAHSAVVLPYTSGFRAQSGVVFLALAHGLPIVASEAGGLGELLAEFPFGVTYRGQAPEALARAICQLHEQGAADRGAAVHEQVRRAKRRYSWDQAAAKTIAAYGAVNAV
jgi:glycosyltransferase involved in cell wall biosynthesis